MDTERTIFFTCLIDLPQDNATFAAGYEEGRDRSGRSCCYLIFQGDGRVSTLSRDRLIELPSTNQNSKSPDSVDNAGGRFGVGKEKLNKWDPLEPDEGAFIRAHVQFARRIGTPCETSPEPIRWELKQYAGVRAD